MEDIEHIEKEMKLIGADGRRLDGRRFDELRPIRIEAGVLRRAGGAPDIEWGGEKGLAGGGGPRAGAPRAPPGPGRGPPPRPDKKGPRHRSRPEGARPPPPAPGSTARSFGG